MGFFLNIVFLNILEHFNFEHCFKKLFDVFDMKIEVNTIKNV